jgi:hypothetical protein
MKLPLSPQKAQELRKNLPLKVLYFQGNVLAKQTARVPTPIKCWDPKEGSYCE